MKHVSLDQENKNTNFSAALKANSSCFRKNLHNTLCSMKKNESKKLPGNSSNGEVNFNVKTLLSTIFRAGNWLSMKGSMVVSCTNLKATLISSPKGKGKLKEGRDQNCKVHYCSD
ncbi:hypothetical protein CJ030_MR1G009592 [Morella rubra]|uniref:Uncharacterized protein n=1 Tax=Morella rubra TaxID=262757 RepID=A0A6A1WP54_9ROSI|nr:hypothetical protein CJ030_MR1G009592 [Morella rubra]